MGNFNRGDRSGGRRDFGGGGRRGDRPTMHHATCGECGKDCEVPFKPTGDRPVLCDDCFGKSRGDRGGRSDRGRGGDRGGRDFGRDKTMYVAVCDSCGDKCEVPFRPTSGKPVYCSKCFDQMGGGSDRGRGGDRGGRSGGNDGLSKQIADLNSKLDRILDALVKTPAASKAAEEKTKAPAKEKKKAETKPKKEAAAKKPKATKTTAKKAAPKKKK